MNSVTDIDSLWDDLGMITSSTSSTSQTIQKVPNVPTVAPNTFGAAPKSEDNLLLSSQEEKALKLLGSGVNAEQVAAALGVTPSRISQLLADKNFADKVADLRYQTLREHTARDSKYDSLEDKLLLKLEQALPLCVRPDTILKALETVNKAKRRGQAGVVGGSTQQTIVQLTLPTKIVERFAVNINNQVIKVGDKDLITVESNRMLKLAEESRNRAALPLAPILDSETGADTENELNTNT